jgi:hypothetical protein
MFRLCSPAMLYLIMATLSIILALIKRIKMISIVVKIAFVILWTWFLNFLCRKGYTDISWFLVLLPFIIMLGTFVIAIETLNKK